MNIHIQNFQSGGVTDPAALEQFQQQWATYQKLVDADSLSHKAVGGLLQEALNTVFTKPFAFLDIACGDASQMRQALKETAVRHFTVSISRSPLLSSRPRISRVRPMRLSSITAISSRR